MFVAISDRENNFFINRSQVQPNRPKTQLQNVGMKYSLGNIFTLGREEMEQFWKMETMGLHQSDIHFCSQQQPFTLIITDKISG